MRAFDLAMSHDEQGELANNIVKQLTKLNKKDMRTEKIKDNPTRIEELEWLLKCAKHYEAGGKLQTNYGIEIKDGEDDLHFTCDADFYEIVLEPEYRPYKTVEEVPVGKVIISKDGLSKYILLRSHLSNGDLWIYTHGASFGAERLMSHYTFEDGSPVGVEVEG